MSELVDCGLRQVCMQWGQKIELRDGIRLHATLYLPSHPCAPAPAILSLTPYVAQVLHEFGTYFAAHGYPFLAVDVRGRGNSEGSFAANECDPKDGYDVVEWLARQTYCNGSVAMWGGSYAGYLQWLTATEMPPHLATIVPVASPFRGVDSPAPSNIFLPYRIQWLALLGGRTSQDKIFADQTFWNQKFSSWFQSGAPFRNIDRSLGFPSEVFQEWLSHPRVDSYWDNYNPPPGKYPKVTIPILTITGMYDVNQLGALAHYREHTTNCSAAARGLHYLVIGPWDHAGTRAPKMEFGGLRIGPRGVLDLQRLHCEWYAWTMQGGEKPEFLRENVAYYVLGTDQWRYARSLEEVTERTITLYLDSADNPIDVLRSGALSVQVSASGEPDCYVYDPHDLSLADLESTIDPANVTDQCMVYASYGKRLFYHSNPCTEDVELAGFFRLCLWLSIDQPDTDFSVAIYRIAPDGTSILLTRDSLRARYRTSLREETLVCSKEPLLYEFKRFPFISCSLSSGSRLRLVVGPVNSIHSEKNYNSGGIVADESMGDARKVTVRVFHEQTHASALFVPIGRAGTRASFELFGSFPNHGEETLK